MKIALFFYIIHCAAPGSVTVCKRFSTPTDSLETVKNQCIGQTVFVQETGIKGEKGDSFNHGLEGNENEEDGINSTAFNNAVNRLNGNEIIIQIF